MERLRHWVREHRTESTFGAITLGMLLAAAITRSGKDAIVTAVVGLFLVLLSWTVNGALDWWENRRCARFRVTD